jgi:hypothetical protein
MSEQFRAVSSMAFGAASADKRPERRQIRRAGIALLVRVRAADFTDGSFDEVRTTQNASRKAIYFFTKLDRYYKGMRVRITSPYDPNAGATNLEQVGEVVRVHRREVDYGVAVALLSNTQSAPPQSSASAPDQTLSLRSSSTATALASERRCATRSPFVAPVEIIEMRTNSRTEARTSDLSPQGCYIDTLNPLPVGSAVRVRIDRGGVTLDVLGNVSSRHVGSGMGLVFGEISRAQRNVLDNWLLELELPRMSYKDPFPARSQASPQEPDCAIRLVWMLLRKGVLNQSEAKEILDDFAADRPGARALHDAI